MDSLGSLVDQLVTVGMKLWHVQAELYECARTYTDLPAASVQKLTSLNLERNRLMTKIDGCLNEAVKTGQAQVDARVKLT